MNLPFSRAAVTGGAGFVGSHIVDRLVHEGVNVTVIDDFSSGKLSNIEGSVRSGKVDVVKGDINDKELVLRALKDIEVVFHEAAIVSVQRSITEPELTNHVNIDGTRSVVEASADSGVHKFILASSAAIYGDSKTLPRKENTLPSPLSPYAESKLVDENLCEQMSKSSGLNNVALRYFNIYGERSNSKLYSGVINAFAERIINRKKPVIYGDGSQSRDFINVKDIIEANLLAASTKSARRFSLFNVGTGRQTTVRDLARLESEILLGHSDIEIEFKEARNGDVKHSYADIALIKRELGFRPTVTLEEGLRKYLSSLFVTAPVRTA